MKELQSYGDCIRRLLQYKEMKAEELVAALKKQKNVATSKSAISRILTGKRMPSEQEAQGMADVLEAPQIYQAYLLLQEYLKKKDAVSILAFYQVLDLLVENRNTFVHNAEEPAIDYSLLYKMLKNLHRYCLAKDVSVHVREGFVSKLVEVSGFGTMIERLKLMYQCFMHGRQLSAGDRAWLATGLLYFISPLDLIPDYLVPYGYLDDSIVVGFIFSELGSILEKYRDFGA
ncbi:DUF1232 domain-containing protein [Effusibacillus pohliae]|uniref:DUF1232 domain-containing protein n=1 Tax=Effusibacillus pohliae TaxID=232270 RepID=UPI000369BF92|nr:DUF1232 domain-containing protein [Effusibacillus pohliae]